jgi:hypothetical protein
LSAAAAEHAAPAPPAACRRCTLSAFPLPARRSHVTLAPPT